MLLASNVDVLRACHAKGRGAHDKPKECLRLRLRSCVKAFILLSLSPTSKSKHSKSNFKKKKAVSRKKPYEKSYDRVREVKKK